MYQAPQVLGTWDVGGRPLSVNSATAVVAGLVPPFMGGPGRVRRVWDFRTPDSRNTALLNSGIIHVEKAVFLNGATNIMQFTCMRPINFTWVTAASTVVSSHTRLLLPNDPAYFVAWGTTIGPTVGMPSTASTYLYDNILATGSVVPTTTAAKWPPSAGVSTNAMAAGDFIAVQVADGTWILDTVLTSYSSQFTTGLPTTGTTGYVDLTGNFPAGSIKAGAPFYYFGPCTSSSTAIASQYLDPATGTLPPTFTVAVSSSMTLTGQSPYGTSAYGLCATLHPGDPMMFALSCNSTPTVLVLETLCGWYSKAY